MRAPVLLRGRQVGALTVEEEGGRWRVSFRCGSQAGLCRLICRGAGGAGLSLGVPQPAGEELRLDRLLTRRELAPLLPGPLTAELVPISAPGREPEPAGEDGSGFLPCPPDVPFPRMDIFLRCRQGRERGVPGLYPPPPEK